jgi:hypothetical protein
MAYVYVEGTTEYAKIFDGQQDMGANLPEGSDQRVKLEAIQGQFVMNLHMTKEAKKKAVADGIPTKGMTGQLWKETDDGDIYYKCTRKNFNPKFLNKETGEQGVLMGPPMVLMQLEDGSTRAWNQAEDGFVGNGSTVVVKFNVWEDKICEMVAIKVVDHVKFEPEQQNGDF